MLDFLFITAGLLCLVPLLISAMRLRKHSVAGAVSRAVEIAASHGFVTPGRLMTYGNVSEQDAKAALADACRRGLLFQLEDQRYYLSQPSLTAGAADRRD